MPYSDNPGGTTMQESELAQLIARERSQYTAIQKKVRQAERIRNKQAKHAAFDELRVLLVENEATRQAIRAQESGQA